MSSKTLIIFMVLGGMLVWFVFLQSSSLHIPTDSQRAEMLKTKKQKARSPGFPAFTTSSTSATFLQ